MVLPHTRFPQPHFLRYPRRKNRSVRKLLNTHAHRLRIHAPRLKRRLKHGINRSFRKSLPQEKMKTTEDLGEKVMHPISVHLASVSVLKVTLRMSGPKRGSLPHT